MPTYRTPGVYVEELSVFPPSVAEVETAIPAFIGYTERATKTAENDLRLRPTKIYSFTEFEQYFGHPKADTIRVELAPDPAVPGTFQAAITPPDPEYILYYAIKLFFDNGGGKCYIVSVNNYQEPSTITLQNLNAGLAAVQLEDEPTLLVIPEAVKLGSNDYSSLSTAMLMQCGRLGDRFAILDLREGDRLLDQAALDTNRGHFGNQFLKYGAAYYPFLKSGINFYVNADETNVLVTIGEAEGEENNETALGALKSSNTAAYNATKAALRNQYVELPPSPAVAGVYAATDTNRGVWKSPANVSLNNVIEPRVRLGEIHQDELNIDSNSGKSINAIRSFAGKGTLVWGARTLAGNDNEWRYVSVRRFFNMVEESIRQSTAFAVFEPNDANTWVKVRGMIENYLTQKWREGALAGATTKEAFFVRCGLGVTMTAQDILEGRMNVEIGMAVVRPAEFIILKFSHKLQTS